MNAQPSSSYAQYNNLGSNGVAEQYLPLSAYSIQQPTHPPLPPVNQPSQIQLQLQPQPVESHSQILQLLTPENLDSKPQQTALSLINLIMQPDMAINEASTRIEILTRIRDNAPVPFFTTFAENEEAVKVLREWLKACVKKKEEYGGTLMVLLQVSSILCDFCSCSCSTNSSRLSSDFRYQSRFSRP